VIPGKFKYCAPSALPEVFDLLQQHPDEAKVLAGGQSLIPLMKFRLASPAYLVDLRNVPGLGALQERNGALVIGAMVREARLESSNLIRQRYTGIHDASAVVADPLVRNFATIGGNLAHADPANEQIGPSVVSTPDGSHDHEAQFGPADDPPNDGAGSGNEFSRFFPGLPDDRPLEAPCPPHEKYGGRERHREDWSHESRGGVTCGHLAAIALDDCLVVHESDYVQAPQPPGDRDQAPDAGSGNDEPRSAAHPLSRLVYVRLGRTAHCVAPIWADDGTLGA